MFLNRLHAPRSRRPQLRSALAREHRPDVLGRLSEIVDARDGVFYAAASKVLDWKASDGMRDIFGAGAGDVWLVRGSRLACWLLDTRPAFLVEHNLRSGSELAENPVCRDFFAPARAWLAGGHGPALADGRNGRSGNQRRFDELRPHLVRAALMSARLRRDRAKADAADRQPAALSITKSVAKIDTA